MGEMRDGIHDEFCTDEHYCECHCPKRFESEAPMGCIDIDCPIEQQYDDEEQLYNKSLKEKYPAS